MEVTLHPLLKLCGASQWQRHLQWTVSRDRKDYWYKWKDLQDTMTTLQKGLQTIGIYQPNNANIYSLIHFHPALEICFPTGYKTKFCKLIGSVTSVNRKELIPISRRESDENISVNTRVQEGRRRHYYCVALEDERKARRIGRQILSTSIMSSSDGQAPV